MRPAQKGRARGLESHSLSLEPHESMRNRTAESPVSSPFPQRGVFAAQKGSEPGLRSTKSERAPDPLLRPAPHTAAPPSTLAAEDFQ